MADVEGSTGSRDALEELRGRRDRRRSARGERGARRVRLTVYLTAEERRRLELRSGATGESMAKLLVDAALHPISAPGDSGGGVPAADQGEARERRAELQDIRLKLAGIGNNINQIARHANTVSEVPADFPSVVAMVGSLCDEINDLLVVRR